MYSLFKIVTILAITTFSTWVTADNQKILRDPTQPPSHENVSASNQQTPDTNISAIFVGKDSQTAIINNVTFVIGDKISNATIVGIDITGITLKTDDGKISKIPAINYVVKIPATNQKEKP